MFRNLIVLCVLALSGCASYSEPRYGAREPVYGNGSYYSPAAEGYGDYYYAPEASSYYYDDYYDVSHRYYGRPAFSGYSPWCSYGHRYGYYYRPCSYGYGYGYGRPGWGLSIFFGDRWGWGGGWSSYWPYDHRHRWHDRDRRWNDRDGRDWNRDREDEPRRPNPRNDEDRNQRYPDEGVRLPRRVDSDREPRIRVRPPTDRNERPRNDRPPLVERPMTNLPPGDRNSGGERLPPRSRDEGYVGFRGPGVGDRNGGDRNSAPRPDRPIVRTEPRPEPVRVERPSDEREDRNDRNERSARSRDEDRPEPRSRPRLQ